MVSGLCCVSLVFSWNQISVSFLSQWGVVISSPAISTEFCTVYENSKHFEWCLFEEKLLVEDASTSHKKQKQKKTGCFKTLVSCLPIWHFEELYWSTHIHSVVQNTVISFGRFWMKAASGVLLPGIKICLRALFKHGIRISHTCDQILKNESYIMQNVYTHFNRTIN